MKNLKTIAFVTACGFALMSAGSANAQTTFSHDNGTATPPLQVPITVVGVGGDLLTEGPAPAPPAVAIAAAAIGLLPGDHIISLSFGNDPIDGRHSLVFSVDSLAAGVVGSGVDFEVLSDSVPCGRGAIAPAACGDIFVQTQVCSNATAPALLGYSPALGAPDGDECNASWNNPAVANVPGGAVDDLNAFDYSSPDDAAGIYFSLDPVSPTLAAIGASAGDILYSDLSGAPPSIAMLAPATPATAAELGIAGLTLDALNVIGSVGSVAGGGGVIAAGGVGPAPCNTGVGSTHLAEYSVVGVGGGDILVRTGPITSAVYVPFGGVSLLASDELNMLEAIEVPWVFKPVPAVSEWGVGLMVLVVLTAATLAMRGRRARAAAV